MNIILKEKVSKGRGYIIGKFYSHVVLCKRVICDTMYLLTVHGHIMNSISYTSLRKNLSSVLEEVEKDHVTYHITRKNHKNMVILAEEDYNSIKETLYLLSNQANAEALNESIIQAQNKNFVDVNLDD